MSMQRPDAPLHRLPLPTELALKIFDIYTAITRPGTPEFLTLLTLSRYHYALNIRRLYRDAKVKEGMADTFLDMWMRWAFHAIQLLAAKRSMEHVVDEDEIVRNLLCPIKCTLTGFNINTLIFQNAICFAKISELLSIPGSSGWYLWELHPSLPHPVRLLHGAKTVVFEEQTLGGGEMRMVSYVLDGPRNGYTHYGAERLMFVMPSRPFHRISPLALNWLGVLGRRLPHVKHVTLEYRTAVVGERATLFKKRKHRLEQIDQVESKIKSWGKSSLQVTVVEPSGP
ncbi:hypothetical protein L198_08308 [Cryptococcus wingfieldii CBS 7118]|uniref:Uncharacterized protein n=1 Tax=Cryptococcus wingfieldii CBS 7118 TaxID=1295528 RepID=A0A1E3H9S2_9TREE|nr:hypothetical protein L198_08311 [Cryptococcus wingfieldii CBS 7118]XP_019027747.1 hypothetical protein L198_08308 [Cryptococcus wingfieldii CBS 7118]ODN73088.1 hypothetical protein L198_08311 [Cryptococcus wingfieldii CBS 7118]ODN73093.1 hypothetical protein L198_08308 [Cryptococcus wingfieldii CBS 7118]